MGAQNGKQKQNYSLVKIDHPKFQNARVYQQKTNIYLQTGMGVQQKEFNKWKQTISKHKNNFQYLLIPKKYDFSSKGLCGSSGTLNTSYDYYPYLLIEQIENRKRRKSKFQQCQLWFLMYSLSAAQNQMKKNFDTQIGDIRPQNIFINQEGQIKTSCLQSWPRETTNYQKALERQQSLLAPQQMKKLQLSGLDDHKNYQSQMFSLGMTILSTALLTDFKSLYDLNNYKFNYKQAKQYLTQWKHNSTYSQIFTAFVSNLCSIEPQKRLTTNQLYVWIHKYDSQINSKQDFVIETAPLKIQQQIRQMRGQNLIQNNILHGGINSNFIQAQQKSVVIPFMQRQVQVPMTQNMPTRNIVYNNVQPAESLYTPIPQSIHQRQYQNGFIQRSTRGSVPYIINQNQNQIISRDSNLGGNFVYTKRIIDPNTKNIIAEQKIGQAEYQKGVVGSFKGIQQNNQ